MKRSQIDPVIFHETLARLPSIRKEYKLKLMFLDKLKEMDYMWEGELIRVYLFKTPQAMYGFKRYRFSIVYESKYVDKQYVLKAVKGQLSRKMYKYMNKRAEPLK